MLRQMRCDRFDDLVASNALLRPGPLDAGMHTVFIRRKLGQERVVYPHPLLKDVLEAPLSPEALGVAVETIYESVGCPEDMLGLWEITAPWSRQPPRGDREAIARFVNRREADLVREG